MATVTTQKMKMADPIVKKQQMLGQASTLIKQVDGHAVLKDEKDGLMRLKKSIMAIDASTGTQTIRSIESSLKSASDYIKQVRSLGKTKTITPLVGDASEFITASQAVKLTR